jgi:hypothetical protein
MILILQIEKREKGKGKREKGKREKGKGKLAMSIEQREFYNKQ